MEDDRQYEYDGPDSEREPVHEEPGRKSRVPGKLLPWEKSRQPLAEQPRTAAKNQAAESGRDSMKWIGIRINTADSLRNGRRPDISRKKTIRPNIGRKRIIRTNTDRTDTSSKPDITGTNTGRR